MSEIPIPNLYAWVGEDELGSGKIGVKRVVLEKGNHTEYNALVTMESDPAKLLHYAPWLEAQTLKYGKKIRLIRFAAVEQIYETKGGK